MSTKVRDFKIIYIAKKRLCFDDFETSKQQSFSMPCIILFIAYYCLEVIYPFAFNNSAINTAPPAAPLNVLCERPMNL